MYKTALDRARRQSLRLRLQHSVDNWITHEEPLTHELVYERFRIVIVGIWPDRAVQPEGRAARCGQIDRSIYQIAGEQLGHKATQPKDDANPLGLHRAVDGSCFCLRPTHCDSRNAA